MLDKISRFALNRSLATGSKFFTAISVATLVVKFVQKISGNAPKTLYTRELKPGEVLLVTDTLKKR